MWGHALQFFAVSMFVVCGLVGLFFGELSAECFTKREWKISIVLLAIAGICFYAAVSIIETTGTIKVSSPIIEETRYEILAGNDTTRVSGSISGGLFHITGSISENSFYKIYYPSVNPDGEDIAVPLTVKENQTEIVFLPDDAQNEYLLNLTTTQLYEFKNKDIYGNEQWSETKSVRYKLYVKRETFNNKIVIDGN